MLQDKKQPVSKVPVCPTDFVIIQVSSYENTVGFSNCFTKYIPLVFLKYILTVKYLLYMSWIRHVGYKLYITDESQTCGSCDSNYGFTRSAYDDITNKRENIIPRAF